MTNTFFIRTFGCQMNEHDSEKMAGMLLEMGYKQSAEENSKDSAIYILNTCSVRDNADNRFFGTLGQLKNVKKRSPDMIVAVCGCMMQQDHIVETLKTKYPWVDLVFGTHNIHQLSEYIDDILKAREKTAAKDKKSKSDLRSEKIISIWEDIPEIKEGLPVKRLYDFKAFVNIMYGCNNFCTYCIVPYTRGREKSRRPIEIINEVKALVATGTKEITLLGQNVNSYGKNCGFDMDFTDLIYELDRIPGLKRLRFMTSHPKDISDKLIGAYRDCLSLQNSIHLPVQSGSSAVLKRMNRNYTKEDYLAIVEKLKAVSPDIAVTTDIIVGFPGETEDDFEETLDLVEKVRFDSAFTFLYSIRKGTPAEKYEDQVPDEVMHERFDRLLELINRISSEKNQAFVGRVVPVLLESPNAANQEGYTGRTPENKIVHVLGNEAKIGEIVDVRITDAKMFNLIGEIL